MGIKGGCHNGSEDESSQRTSQTYRVVYGVNAVEYDVGWEQFAQKTFSNTVNRTFLLIEHIKDDHQINNNLPNDQSEKFLQCSTVQFFVMVILRQNLKKSN